MNWRMVMFMVKVVITITKFYLSDVKKPGYPGFFVPENSRFVFVAGQCCLFLSRETEQWMCRTHSLFESI